jgi:DASH complex subunit SPC19
MLPQSPNQNPKLIPLPTQHFELTPSSSLTAAQASLASELRPAITTLLQRVETHCAKLERREQALVAKSELQEGRLGQAAGTGSARNSRGKSAKVVAGSGEMGLRLKALRQKKERLAYAVERLTLQSQQRQRQLRMSVNVSAP